MHWKAESIDNLGLEVAPMSEYDTTPILGAPFLTLGISRHSLETFIFPTEGGAIAFSYQYAF